VSEQRKSIRLNKLLASVGVASRRSIDQWIEQGRITVDGKLAALGAFVTADQEIRLDGQSLDVVNHDHKILEVIKYNKPVNVICSRQDERGRETVFDHLPTPRSGRWISIGRLDFKTTGLLIFTNDGELAHKMMHPSTQIEREYHVKIQGDCELSVLKALKEGVYLEDGWACVESINILEQTQSEHTWLSVILKEGRNREVRRLFEAVGKSVVKLSRVRYGSISLPETLGPGRVEYLTAKEKDLLMKEVGL